MKLLALLIVGAFAALATGACGREVTRGEPVGNGIRVTTADSATRNHEVPSLLRDRNDADTFYLAEVELLQGSCEFYRSTDAGRTWQPGAAPTRAPYTDCGLGSTGPTNIRTELDQAPDGTLYYAYHAQDPSDEVGARSVLLGRSGDGGRSWNTTVVAEAPEPEGKKSPVQLNFVPHVAIDPDDPRRVYMMWRRSFGSREEGEDGPPTRPWMAVSRDGGASFEEPFEMLDKDTGFDGPRPIVRDGRLYAFYRVAPPETDEDEEPQKTRLVAGVSTDDGRTWQEHEIASALDASEPVPLYDAQRGSFDVVWHDNRNGDLDVFFSTSRDARTWTAPRRVNNDPLRNKVGQFYPQISQAPDGRVDVSWYDYRDDFYPPEGAGSDEPLTLFNNLGIWQTVYVSHSSDGGGSWSPDVRTNPAVRIDRSKGTWNLRYFVQVPPAVASTNDRTLVAWSDTRDGTSDDQAQDIYLGRVSYSGDGGAEASGGDGGLGGLFAALLAVSAAAVGAGLALIAAMIVTRRRRGASPPGSGEAAGAPPSATQI